MGFGPVAKILSEFPLAINLIVKERLLAPILVPIVTHFTHARAAFPEAEGFEAQGMTL